MTKLPTIFFAVLIVSCIGHAAAQDRAQMAQTAVDHMAQETVDCAAYFHIISIALSNSGDPRTAEQFSQANKTALERADSLNEGIVGARYNSTVVDMTDKIVVAEINRPINKDLSNISILDISVLDSKYGNLCKVVMADPAERAQYWMEHNDAPQ